MTFHDILFIAYTWKIQRTGVSPKDYQNEYVSVPASIPVVTRTITCPLDSGKNSVTKISVASQYKSVCLAIYYTYFFCFKSVFCIIFIVFLHKVA